jgi:hypothetical protein
MQFSWGKGFGLGRAIPDWLHFVIEWGEAVGRRGGFGVWGGGVWIARGD